MATGRSNRKLALVMVGLPARGKTYTAKKLARYLAWLGYNAQVFNVGNYRRTRLGAHQPHEFFDPNNPAGAAARRELAMEALDDMLGWLRDTGDVAIYDATNSNKERRARVQQRCEQANTQVLFIESRCDDEAIIEQNIRSTKLAMPDYEGLDPNDAVADFRARISHYEEAYQTVDDDEGSYIKLIDVGRQIQVNRVDGYLAAHLVSFLLNLHLTQRPILLTRHGESAFNEMNLIGGDPNLAERGVQYAKHLAAHLDTHFPKRDEVTVWTSSLQRTIETASHLNRASESWRALDEIDAGVCDGMSYAQIKSTMPDEYAARSRDKFRYRYPRGESYQDVIQRLDRVIIELERQRSPIVIVAHQAVIRVLYAYLMEVPPERSPHLSIPLHTVIELSPHAYGCTERRIPLGPHVPSASSG